MRSLTVATTALMLFGIQSADAKIKFSELDQTEQTAVYFGFCSDINSFQFEKNAQGQFYDRQFDFKNLHGIINLVFSILSKDENKQKYGIDHLFEIANDVGNDLQKRIILEEFNLSQDIIDRCITDGKKILSEQYIDSLDYVN